MFVLFVMQSYLTEVRGLKQRTWLSISAICTSYLTEVRGLKLSSDTEPVALVSYLTEVRYLISLVKKL